MALKKNTIIFTYLGIFLLSRYNLKCTSSCRSPKPVTSAPAKACRNDDGAAYTCRSAAPYRRARSLHAGLLGAPPYTSPRVTRRVPSNDMKAAKNRVHYIHCLLSLLKKNCPALILRNTQGQCKHSVYKRCTYCWRSSNIRFFGVVVGETFRVTPSHLSGSSMGWQLP